MDIVKIIIFLFVLSLIFIIFKYFFYNKNTLTNVSDAKTMQTISASSLETTATGSVATNYTYSVWIYINGWNYRYGDYKIILGRMGGSSGSDTSTGLKGIYGANPCPLLVLGAVENMVICKLTTYGSTDETANTDAAKTTTHTQITNIPLQSWVNLIMVVNNQALDFYMNGKLVKSELLPGTAYVDSTSNLFITPDGGFDGYTANVQYWASPKNPEQVWNIYQNGYKNNFFSSLFNSYEVQINVSQNGITQGSVSI